MSTMPMTPNMNPTGAIGTGGITPPTGGAGSYNFGNSMNPFLSSAPNTANPFLTSTPGQGPLAPQARQFDASAPAANQPVMNPGSSGTASPQFTTGNPGNTPAQSDEFGWALGQTFGTGTGSVIEQFLQSGGGYNLPLTQQTVSAQEAAMQQAIQRGWGNISANEAETGVGPNSSTQALTEGDYFSNAVTQENAIIAQEFQNMWTTSMGNEVSILGDILNPTATNKAGRDSSWMSDLSSFVGMGTSVFNALGDAGLIPG